MNEGRATGSRVTVCLPTYNRAALLKETLTSILAQTFRDFEVIVGDNCSTDSTAETMESVHDPRVRYIRNDVNIGHYRNMNQLLDLAGGEFVCIVHDDDVYGPEFLAREVALLERQPRAAMVHCAAYLVSSDRRRQRLHRVKPQTTVAGGLQEFVKYVGGHDVCCSTVMWRRAIVGNLRFESDLMCADWLMWLMIALRGDVGYIAEPLVEIRVHDGSMSAAMTPDRWYREFLELVDRAFVEMRVRHPELASQEAKLLRDGSRSQGRRFFVAALAAAAEGQADAATGFVGVLDSLASRGISPWRSRLARALITPPGRRLLVSVRQARRMLAEREARHHA